PKEANEPLSGINNADLIFEYLAESGKPEYTAIFHDKIPAKTSPIKQLGDISIKKLPSFSFCRSSQKTYESKRAANYIFITLNYDISSNFIYENGFYKHFKDTAMDFDTSNAAPVLVSNIIIQFTDNYEGMENVSQLGMGKGLLFCGGKIIDIHWQNDGSSPIKVEDENGNPVQLQNGSTWWVIINKNCPVAYN
ncbi:MAG: DUF3048 C-terminal domain-containing protein, partial [Bacillota bacterium]|nr:DUF3048 C-terminal domain-containing protein [Bacillota bacterium]